MSYINRTIIVERDSQSLNTQILTMINEFPGIQAAVGEAEAAASSASASASEASTAAGEATSAATNAVNAAKFIFADQAALLADNRAFSAGDIILTRAEGYSYEVVSSDPDLTTAGGALLRVLPTIDGSYSVDAFGAIGDGTTDDTAAFQRAIDALPAVGGEIVLSKPDYAILGALVTGGRKILWKGGARINNSVYPSVPGIFESYDPANARRVVSRVGAGNAEFVQQDYYRTTGYAAAPDGVDTLLRAFTTINAGSSTSGPNPRDEWPFLARVDNYSDSINGVANTGQARRHGKGAVWSGHFNTYDHIDPTTSPYAAWGFEANIQGDGGDPDLLRRVGGFIAHSTSGNYATPGANVIGRGVLVQPDSADYGFGIHIMTGAGAGVSKGEFRNAALRIDAKAPDLIAARNPVGTGVIKVGTGLDAGVAAQVVGVGNNASALPAIYTEIRTTISSNTAGSETGTLGLWVSASGIMDEMINLSPVGGVQMKIGGSLKQVSQGAADSGGAGFRVLLVPN